MTAIRITIPRVFPKISIVSKADFGNRSSTIPKSREHRLSKMPIGLLSKKEIGALITDLKRRLCKLTEAFIQIVKNDVVRINENTNNNEIIDP